MNCTALPIPIPIATFTSMTAMGTAPKATTTTVARSEKSVTNTVVASRFDFDLLPQRRVHTTDFAEHADASGAAVNLSFNPINLTLWTVLFAAVNERIAGTVALMLSDVHGRNELSSTTISCQPALLECAEALDQLRVMFPLCQAESTSAKQESRDTGVALANAQAALLKSHMLVRVAQDLVLHERLVSLRDRALLIEHLKHASGDPFTASATVVTRSERI